MDTQITKPINVWKSWSEVSADDVTLADQSARTNEFFPGASSLPADLNRRQFLSLAAASLAVAGFTGCTRTPLEKIIPYVTEPQGAPAGTTQFFATAWSIGGQTQGLLAESQLGRPVKLDGNPMHPANLGKSSALHQALLLSLYDENRCREVTQNGKPKSWDQFAQEMTELRAVMNDGRGVVFLTEISSSPSLQHQFQQLQLRYPGIRWLQYEPVSLARAQNALGAAPVYQLEQARAVICFDADIFGSPLYPLKYTSAFFKNRSLHEEQGKPPSLFVAEPTPSLTGTWTKHRLSIKASRMPLLCQKLLKGENTELSESEVQFLKNIKSQITLHPDHCAFFAGPHQPASVHSLCHELNTSYGKQVVAYAKNSIHAADFAALKKLAQDLDAGQIEALFIVGGNPSYQTPVELALGQKMGKAKRSYRFSLAADETSTTAQWQLPLAHAFEAWSDGVAFDGTTSIHQPLIAPLFDGKSIHEILALLMGAKTSSYDIVKDYWRHHVKSNFDSAWDDGVQKGILQIKTMKLDAKVPVTKWEGPPPVTPTNDLEIIFRADSNVWDGRFAGNPWLQELPRHITLLSWGNAALISPALAKEKNIRAGQIVVIQTAAGRLRAPAWIVPGQEAKTITLHFGYGRKNSGSIANDVGFNAYEIWSSDHPDFVDGSIEVTGEHEELACMQTHNTMDDKNIIRAASATKSKQPSLYPDEPVPAAAEAWAMVIDLDHCIGCNACTAACQSENNIPVVGKKGVLNGREMHWIRVDRYFSGDETNPQFAYQPVPCMHCEKAPCEEVCPVAATVHSTDGLNQMIYNRCVGTRYCANNCPYKVRRFNFLTYTDKHSELQKLQQNPEVSVRPRGVMEKCTYCVQRINAARIKAESERRAIRDLEVQTACQVACPTEAIVFGNQNEEKSRVRQQQKKSRRYTLLEELGTKPRTTYLAKVDDDL